MAYVLDESAIIALARDEKNAEKTVGEALKNHKCYVTPATLANVYYTLYEKDGESAADYWLGIMTAGLVVTLEPCMDFGTIQAAGRARLITNLPLGSTLAAAVAQQKNIPVITRREGFEDLVAAGFCKVKWLG